MFRDICRMFVLALVAGALWVGGNAQVTSSSAMAADEDDALTKAYVMKGIERYDRDGREATLAYYSSQESIEGDRFMPLTRSKASYWQVVYPFTSVRPRPDSVQSLRKASGWIIKVFTPEPDS